MNKNENTASQRWDLGRNPGKALLKSGLKTDAY